MPNMFVFPLETRWGNLTEQTFGEKKLYFDNWKQCDESKRCKIIAKYQFDN